MRILQIHNRYLYAGGEDEVVLSEKRMLERFGHEVFLYERHNKELSQSSGLKRLGALGRVLDPLKPADDKLEQCLRHFKPDIAHVHNVFYVISPAIFATLKRHGIPVVHTLHNYRYLCPAATFYRDGQVCEDCLKTSRWQAVLHRCWKNSMLHSWLLKNEIDACHRGGYLHKNVNAFIALSQFSRGKFISGGFDPKQVVVKGNFLDTDPGYQWPKKPYVVYAGALKDYKGVDVLIKAWQKMPSALGLKIMGDGPLMETLKALNRHPGVEFMGRVSMEEVLAQIRQASALVLPSLCYENFPRVIVEAYACGTPVVAGAIGAIKELVNDGKTGFLFTPGHADDLARVVSDLLNNPGLLEQMSQEARKTYVSSYTMDTNYDELMAIYKQVMGPKAAQGAK